MMCYRDMTFCPFYIGCAGASACGRPLTLEVEEAAEKWWGEKGAPIAVFVDLPTCYRTGKELKGCN